MITLSTRRDVMPSDHDVSLLSSFVRVYCDPDED